MRSEHELHAQLRELHGEEIRKEMGGMSAVTEANALLWALGYDHPNAHSDRWGRGTVDVSDYVEVEGSQG